MRISDWSSDVCSSDLIGTIRDLIAYRRRYDHLVECVAELPFKSEFGGDWVAKSFTNKASGGENLALVKGRIDPGKPTLVRMHVMSPLSDVFGAVTPRARLLEQSMRLIAEEGTAVVVVINRAGPGQLSRILKADGGSAQAQVG